jgi:ubiquinone/menaquinone biosynthesis C-methylase UbiE
MTASVSFDRAAEFYDQTRTLPKGMLEKGLPLILEHAGPGGLILDVGAGTGRINE